MSADMFKEVCDVGNSYVSIVLYLKTFDKKSSCLDKDSTEVIIFSLLTDSSIDMSF